MFYALSEEFNLVRFINSDWAGSTDDWRSTSGCIFKLRSCVITQASKKQESIALSLTEGEYVAAITSACQAILLGRLVRDFGVMLSGPISLMCDNQSIIFIARNPSMHGRTKNISIKYHYLRELVTNGFINLEFCHTNEQLTDICTKALSIQKHLNLGMDIGMKSFKSQEGGGCDQKLSNDATVAYSQKHNNEA